MPRCYEVGILIGRPDAARNKAISAKLRCRFIQVCVARVAHAVVVGIALVVFATETQVSMDQDLVIVVSDTGVKSSGLCPGR